MVFAVSASFAEETRAPAPPTPDYDYSFGFNIPAQTQKIGSIKVFVRSGFNSAEPLAEPKELKFAN